VQSVLGLPFRLKKKKKKSMYIYIYFAGIRSFVWSKICIEFCRVDKSHDSSSGLMLSVQESSALDSCVPLCLNHRVDAHFCK
jgi:hypothetical protein